LIVSLTTRYRAEPRYTHTPLGKCATAGDGMRTFLEKLKTKSSPEMDAVHAIFKAGWEIEMVYGARFVYMGLHTCDDNVAPPIVKRAWEKLKLDLDVAHETICQWTETPWDTRPRWWWEMMAEEFREEYDGKDSRNYDLYIKSSAWREVREDLFNIFGEHCSTCLSSENLHVHHKTYENLFAEDVDNDLEVLCQSCHFKVHQDKTSGRSANDYGDDEYDEECEQCGKTIKSCYRLCYECNEDQY
jgi:hypothetical protein